jgi:hypothetical protein
MKDPGIKDDKDDVQCKCLLSYLVVRQPSAIIEAVKNVSHPEVYISFVG